MRDRHRKGERQTYRQGGQRREARWRIDDREKRSIYYSPASVGAGARPVALGRHPQANTRGKGQAEAMGSPHGAKLSSIPPHTIAILIPHALLTSLLKHRTNRPIGHRSSETNYAKYLTSVWPCGAEV